MTKTFKHALLGAAAAIALGSFTGSANATPYAFGEETFKNFVITLSGATLTGGSVTATDHEDYPGAANGGTNSTVFGSSGNAGSGISAGNVAGGPNTTYTVASPAPVTTSTPSPVGESTLKGGLGAQAASSVGGLDVFHSPGDGAYEVAEAGGSPGGTANGADARQTETVNFTVATGTIGATLDVSANVQGFIEALTQQVGETATSDMFATLTLSTCDPVTGICTQVGSAIAPTLLNQNVAAGPSNAGDQKIGSPGFTFFDTTPIALAANTIYKVSFQSGVDVTTASIPEPASLMILASGLIGLGLAFKRRKNTQA